MAKILISPIGTGGLSKDNTSAREYRKTNYKIDEKVYERSFVSSALKDHLGIDHILFIGTVKSMWEEVYRFYNEDKGSEERKLSNRSARWTY